MSAPASPPSALAQGRTQILPLALSPTARRWNRRPLPLAARVGLGVEVLVAYLAVRRSISRAELPSVMRTLRSSHRHHAACTGAAADLTRDLSLRLGFAVQGLLRRIPDEGPCMVRSLVLTRLLARRQIQAELVIGVCSQPSFSAHAWVEHGGRPLLPTDAAHERLVSL